jgi:hypothetical protein
VESQSHKAPRCVCVLLIATFVALRNTNCAPVIDFKHENCGCHEQDTRAFCRFNGVVECEYEKLSKATPSHFFSIRIWVSPPLGKNTVEPGYNDVTLYDTSRIQRRIFCGTNSSLLIITLHYSFITTQNIQSPSWCYNRVQLYFPF